MIDQEFYTVVFRGDVRKIGENLFKHVSPFGEVIGICVGDLMEEIERMRDPGLPSGLPKDGAYGERPTNTDGQVTINGPWNPDHCKHWRTSGDGS